MAEGEAFACWAREGTDRGSDAARNGLVLLTRLYAAGLALPMRTEGGLAPTIEAAVDPGELEHVYKHAARLPLDLYSEVLDPRVVPSDAPGVGSLADDIRDVYQDVMVGVLCHRAGQPEEAMVHWSVSMWTHWGAHSTSAIHVLHCWLAQNDPDRLSGDNLGPDASRSPSRP